jgi:nitrate ABC transporter ATP-binding subunit
MMIPDVRFDSVSKSFGRGQHAYTAVTDITLDVRRGEFVSFIGHSGCGKSTLLNLVAGLSAPTSGAVLVEGAPVTEPGPDRAMVFQHHGLLPWLSVHDNVDIAVAAVDPGSPTGHGPLRPERVEAVLRAVGLWDHRHKRPSQISGGMKQRTAIARAFAVQPRLLLLDEPFGALDALTKSSLHGQLLDLWSADRNCDTVLMVTHDIDESIFLSDRVVVMTNGPAATIREVVDIDLPRPREKRAVMATPRFVELKDHLLGLLTESSLEAEQARELEAV